MSASTLMKNISLTGQKNALSALAIASNLTFAVLVVTKNMKSIKQSSRLKKKDRWEENL